MVEEPPPHDETWLGVVGHTAALVIAGIGLWLLSSRWGRVLSMILIAPIGVVVLLVAWFAWGGLLYFIGDVLGIPVGTTEARTPVAVAGRIAAVLLVLGPPLVVTFLAIRWVVAHVLPRLRPWLEKIASDQQG